MSAARRVHGGMSVPPVHAEQYGAPRSTESRRKIARPLFPQTLAEMEGEAKEDARVLIQLVFPADSENATCMRAEREAGIPVSVTRSYLRCEVKRPSYAIVKLLLGLAFQRLPNPMSVPGIQRVVVGAMKGPQ